MGSFKFQVFICLSFENWGPPWKCAVFCWPVKKYAFLSTFFLFWSIHDKLKDIYNPDNERLWSSPVTLQSWSKQQWLQCNPMTDVQINLWLSTQWCCSFLHHAQWNPHFTSCTSNSSHHFYPLYWANCTCSQFPLACIVKRFSFLSHAQWNCTHAFTLCAHSQIGPISNVWLKSLKPYPSLI